VKIITDFLKRYAFFLARIGVDVAFVSLHAVAYARDRGSLCQDFISSGIAKKHFRANVGLLRGGGAHREL
jgi:hypothetical protein